MTRTKELKMLYGFNRPEYFGYRISRLEQGSTDAQSTEQETSGEGNAHCVVIVGIDEEGNAETSNGIKIPLNQLQSASQRKVQGGRKVKTKKAKPASAVPGD